MDIRLDKPSAYRTATCVLSKGESVTVETGAMVTMSEGLKVSPTSGGGILKGLWRRKAGGEGFLMAKYESQFPGAWIQIAPPYPGDIATLEASQQWTIQTGAFLAMGEDVDLSTKVTGLKTFAMREGLTMLQATGHGPVVVCSYGAIQTMELAPNTSITVDTGHLVGWSGTVRTKTGLLGSAVTAKLSGEMLVTVCTGPGTVLVQTRSEQGLHSWLTPDRYHNNPQ